MSAGLPNQRHGRQVCGHYDKKIRLSYPNGWEMA